LLTGIDPNCECGCSDGVSQPLVPTSSINGTDGTDGSKLYNGTTVPSNGLGAVGDYYIRTTNGFLYEKTGTTTWTYVMTLVGATGATGATGASGTSFPVGIGIFDPGVWAMAVVADTTDCSSLSFADCQAEGGYVGSTVFGIAETGPVSNTNQSTLAAGLMVMLTAMIVAGYGTFKIINP